MESDATDKPVPREISALLSDERLILRETKRAVTPFGGIAVFIFPNPVAHGTNHGLFGLLLAEHETGNPTHNELSDTM
jgi:hypothetical protein